ncbi:UDP-N-acetylglucosamine 2-epimerase (non-hydrolyzing) [Candidatus Pseudothioglobus singularis]|nr:UDP-N-acetylglucosamine 2-epimerase (non-hydrolyzing) [Candidatus Pseudothioglobus singularis]
MGKLKVMTVVGTRPEIIRLSRVIAKLDIYTEHILVHTGQNYDYELNEIFFDDLNIRKPDYFLNAAGLSSSETIGNVIIKVDQLLKDTKPDALLVLGDTNSSMSVIPAKKRKIPIFHMEAGNRCFDQRVPEEINRKIADHTSDINLTYSSIARDYLLREGLRPDMIIKIGSPMNEVIWHHHTGIDKSDILNKLKLKKKNFYLVSAHREENIESEENFNKLIKILNTISKKFLIPVVVSTHPRTQKKIDKEGIRFNENVNLIKPLGFKDFNKLQISAKAVLSDSGTITEESSILNFPAINIREAHERPEGMEEASVMMVGLDKNRILQALSVLDDQNSGSDRLLNLVADYQSKNVSDKVVRIILSYVDYVNQNIWKINK